MANENPVVADPGACNTSRDAMHLRHPLSKMLGVSIPSKNRPFTGKSFYLDLPNNKNMQFLIGTIRKLGGVTESFLSKEVTYVVSNSKLVERSSARTELQHSQVYRQAKTHFLSSGAFKDSSAKPQQQKPTHNHALFSRGKELLQKVISNQDASGGSNLLANAQSWGVRILHVSELLAFVKQLSLEARNSSNFFWLKERCHSTKMKSLKVMKLKSPFLKIEDSSRLFRPLHHRFQCFPELNYLAPRAVNPYKQQKAPLSPHKLGKTEDTVGCATNSEREEEQQSTKLAPSAPKRKKGFCECCRQTFQELGTHLQSEPHRRFAQNASQYLPVDRIISQFSDCFAELPAASHCRSLDHSAEICLAQNLEHGHVKDIETVPSLGLEHQRNHRIESDVQKSLNECSGLKLAVDQAGQMAMAATLGKADCTTQSFPCVQELSCDVDQSGVKDGFSLQDASEFIVEQTLKEHMGLCDTLSVCRGSDDNMDGPLLRTPSPVDTEVTRASLAESCSPSLRIAHDRNLNPHHKAETPTTNELDETLLAGKKRKRSNEPNPEAACVGDPIEFAGWDATRLCEKWTVERMNTNAPSLQETSCLLPDNKKLCSSASPVLAVSVQPNLFDQLHHEQDQDNMGVSMSNQLNVASPLTANGQGYEMDSKPSLKDQPVEAGQSLICSTNSALLGHQIPMCLKDTGAVAQLAVHELQSMASETYKDYKDTHFVKVAHFTGLSCMGLPSCTSCREQEMVEMDQPKTESTNISVLESSLQTGPDLLLDGSFSSESEWDIPFLTRLDQMQATRDQNLDAEILRRTCISMQDSAYESHLCSVLKQRTEQDWAIKEKSLANCRTETGIPFTLMDTCLDSWTS